MEIFLASSSFLSIMWVWGLIMCC